MGNKCIQCFEGSDLYQQDDDDLYAMRKVTAVAYRKPPQIVASLTCCDATVAGEEDG